MNTTDTTATRTLPPASRSTRLIANVTGTFLWFALTFWAYLETRSVHGHIDRRRARTCCWSAVSGIVFGAIVDAHDARRPSMVVVHGR